MDLHAEADPSSVMREYEQLIGQLIRENAILKVALRDAQRMLGAFQQERSEVSTDGNGERLQPTRAAN